MVQPPQHVLVDVFQQQGNKVDRFSFRAGSVDFSRDRAWCPTSDNIRDQIDATWQVEAYVTVVVVRKVAFQPLPDQRSSKSLALL
ncbi:hypothetical protein D3C80_1505090 [compost metagenome]